MSFLEKIFTPDIDSLREILITQQKALDAALSDAEDKKAELQSYESELINKETDLIQWHKDLLKQYNVGLEYRRKLQAYAKRLRERECIIQEKEDDLRKIEHNALIAINRWERKEWAYLQELQATADKLTMYSSIVHRRNGFKFEAYVADLLKENGFTEVKVTKQSGDYGGDVFAVKNGLNYIFQCKYYSQPVGIHAVQEAAAALEPYNADRGVVVTNNVFTTAAKQLAKANEIELWDCSDLAKMNTSGVFY